jgi:polyferredoxin
VNAFNRLAALLPGGMRLRLGKSPGWLTHRAIRVAWFSILLATLVSGMILGLRFHLFTIITVIGIILCRVYPAAWCNGLCPWGALLQCSSRLSPLPRKARHTSSSSTGDHRTGLRMP